MKQLMAALMLLALIMAGVLTISTVGTASAAPEANYSITMTPSSSELHAAPGATTDSTFTVVNRGSAGYNMRVSVAPYHVNGEQYDPQFTVLPGTTDASKWIKISGPVEQFIKAGLPQTINYTLTVPAGTAPGGYYAVIFAETEPPAGSGVVSHNRVGDILYITVDGSVTQKGAATAGGLPHVFLGSSLPLNVTVQNSGGVHFLTTVNLAVTSLLGKTDFQAHTERYVLPQTQRLITNTWSNLPLFGIYKVKASATVAGAAQPLPTRWVVIVRPWLLITITAIVIGTIAVSIWRRIRRTKSHGGKEAEGDRVN